MAASSPIVEAAVPAEISPAGTTANSPAIHRWEKGKQIHPSPARAEAERLATSVVFSPDGTRSISPHNPAIKSLVIGRPYPKGALTFPASATSPSRGQPAAI